MRKRGRRGERSGAERKQTKKDEQQRPKCLHTRPIERASLESLIRNADGTESLVRFTRRGNTHEIAFETGFGLKKVYQHVADG